VDFTTSDASATAGLDYSSTSGTLFFAAGTTAQTFSIEILDDALGEGRETVALSLSDPMGGATLGNRKTATLSIVDDEVAIQFSLADYTVNEASGTANIKVLRSGPVTGTSTVQFATNDGSATAPADYIAKSGTLRFAPGVTSQSIAIPISNDTLEEGPETLSVTLSNPTGALLGPNSTATIAVADNDEGGVLQFSAASYRRSEPPGPTNGVAIITVSRRGGAASGVSVDFATTDGTATAGLDYTGTTTTLSFGAGVVSRTVAIPVLHDTLNEPAEALTLTLGNPTGGATLGARTTATLTIDDNDAGTTILP